MIIKVLLFIIILIFAYETYLTLSRMSQEYFQTLDSNKQERFVQLSGDKYEDDIARTIAINCNKRANKVDQIMAYLPDDDETIDNPYYARYKPLEYDPKRKYYWRRDILIPEGKRRYNDDEQEILKVKNLFDKETNPEKKQSLQDELDLFKWRKNVLQTKNKDTGLERSMRDITTDYFPEEIGMSRPWREIHSHIPDYSY
jgi:hypothetical protein